MQADRISFLQCPSSEFANFDLLFPFQLKLKFLEKFEVLITFLVKCEVQGDRKIVNSFLKIDISRTKFTIETQFQDIF